MKKLEEIERLIEEHKKEIKEKYYVREIGIFGSYIRGDANPESDLDILVKFDKTPGLFDFLDLEEYLTDLLGIKVDLVMKNSLKPYIGKIILNEAKYL
ncbi:MAG: Nucleotidyltransferase domain protein [Candidatus Methanofastidiosum methylothiophilum]|uniref:protein adenylyltransferase n=1 Tax=Candidatus Methanofastidiosum methylothiophilum TaxID=1705564 RepID=A0A150IX72_9EURY|nr:MAG: Nucleotidyltransferase domain protein [Candidatus Methanofastidiosum methylthiophilus]NMD01173.1 nucleotidyltransferase family protein [Bacteroidales bacterium]